MNDEKLKEQLRGALRSMQVGDTPEFDTVWNSAEKRYLASRSRYKRFAGLAAAAVVAATAFMLWQPNGNNSVTAYLTEEDLMSSTKWLAPSDGLLPEHRVDVYSQIPQLIEAND